jgi:hypothetical protein
MPFFIRNAFFKTRYCVPWPDKPLITDDTLKELILVLSRKILSIAELEFL